MFTKPTPKAKINESLFAGKLHHFSGIGTENIRNLIHFPRKIFEFHLALH